MTSTTRITRRFGAAWLSVALAAGSLLVVAPSVFAGTALSIAPNIPFNNAAVTVGDTLVASTLTITNNSDGAQATGIVRITNATLTPSSPDTGVFSLSATGTGDASTPACTGSSWNITGGPVTWTFTPTSDVDLQSTNPPGTAANAKCKINFTVNVVNAPITDTNSVAAGIQTDQASTVSGRHDPLIDNLPASGSGAGQTTVDKISPTLPTTPSAGGPIGTVLNDSATVTGGSSPTGSITFNLYAPTDTTCASTALYNQVVALTGASATTSPGFTTLVAGIYRWTASYPGDANNNSASSGCQAEQVTVTQPVTGLIAPTNTSCSDFTSGNAQQLPGIFYTLLNGKITQNINPGVFFYFSTVTTTTANQVVNTSQETTNTTGAKFGIHQGQAWLWTSNCVTKIVGSQTGGGSTASFTVPIPGTYIIQIKYSPKSIVGTATPSPATSTYSFDTDGTINASVNLVKK